MATRNGHVDDEFSMKVGNRSYSGKGAREEAAKAFVDVVTSWRGDETTKVRGHYRGFDLLSKGSPFKGRDPEIYVRGKAIYEANLNTTNPVGTIQSIESVLRSLDRRAEEERRDIERNEKALADFKAQLNKPFEHEERLKELLINQAQLNASLDLDKHETQVVADTPEIDSKTLIDATFAGRLAAETRGVELAQ